MKPSYIIEDLHDLVVRTADLVFMDENPRVHDERSIGSIGASLATFKQTKPIVLASDGKTVIAGNGTLRAAISLGREWIAAVTSDLEAGSEEAKAYAIADNRTTDTSSFDMSIVDKTLRSFSTKSLIEAAGFDINAFPGIDFDDDGEDDEPGIEIPKGTQIESGARSVPSTVLGGETEGGETSESSGAPQGPFPASIRYDITFETNEEQQEFFEFTRWLKSVYPDIPTVGGRVVEFLRTRGADVWGG